MFSFLFGSLGAGLGKYWGRFAGLLGRNVGYSIGSYLDESLFGRTPKITYGPKAQEPTLQSNTYGRFIPIVYGKTKIYGNIIWASELHESASVQVKKIRSGFIIRERNGILEFISKSYKSHNINADDIIQNNKNSDLQIARNNDSGFSQLILHHITNDGNYQNKNCFARSENLPINGKKSVYLPFAISDHYAKNLAENMMIRINQSKNKLQLSLPSKYHYITVGDNISLLLQGYKFHSIVQNIEINNTGIITIESLITP